MLSAQGLINVKHYSIEDGLSQNTIQDIIQDHEGYIWLATWNGLEKFDGYSFKNYKSYPTDEVRLQYNRMQSVKLGIGKTLWCETYDNKLYLFDIQQEQYIDIWIYHPDIKECDHVNRSVILENGVVWIIGRNGELWRIDEKKYKDKTGMSYIPSLSVPEHGECVYEIILDQYNNEWILTNNGCWVYGKEKMSDNRQFRYAVKADNLFFMAEEKGKLVTFDTEHGIQNIMLPHPVHTFYGLYPLREKKLALATDRGILVYNYMTGSFQYVTIDKKAEAIRPENIFQASNGDLWWFSGKKVMNCDLINNQIKPINYPAASRKNISFIHEDEYGRIWVLPPFGELSFYNTKMKCLEQAYSYNKGKKVYYRAIGMSYLIDSHKNLWSRCGSGFDKISFSNGGAEYISQTYGIEVRGLFIDTHGHLWIADKNKKVEIYDNQQNYCGNLSSSGAVVKDKQVTLGADIYCFFEDTQHRIWMGSKGDGLFIATPQANGYKLTRFTHQEHNPNSINSNSIYSICQDVHGRIWIGTYGEGINLVEGTFPKLKFINKNNGLRYYPQQQCGRVRDMRCTSNGIMMIGTTDGLLTFSTDFTYPGEIRFYHNKCEKSRPESLSNNDILYVFESSSQQIYVATFSSGISKMESIDLLSEQIVFSHINRTNGLASDMAYSIVEDNDNNLWISLENSFCRYNPAEKTFETYDRFNLCTNLSVTEATPVIDNENRIYLGTYEGALQIDLKQLKKSSFIPPIAFTKADIHQNDILSETVLISDNKLVLDADERNVTISFAALDFTNREKLKYAYRLKDINEQWIYISQNHSASFVDLPAGDLILEVKSTNGDGVWMDNIAELTIHVEPTFRETGWVWAIYVFLILVGIFIVSMILTYTLNLRRKVDLEQQLTSLKLRFFTDISHELRTPLTLISNPIEEVLEQEPLSKEGQENMMIAKRNTDRMLKLINQLLDFRKIQNSKMKLYIEQVDVISLFRQVYNDFSNLALQKNIDFKLDCVQESYMLYTDVDKLEKILFNLLSNAFKYTPDGKSIHLALRINRNMLVFSVEDEGKGFDLRKVDTLFDRFETLEHKDNHLSSGIGLSVVKELVNLLHGSMKVDSTLGQGSFFEITVPGEYDTFKSDKNVEFILNDSQQSAIVSEYMEQEEEMEKDIMVLVVEDNEELRHFLMNILRKTYRVIEANNGKKGLELILSEMPDVIISDIMMPEMDGIELLETVKKNPNVSHISFILLSAKASLDDRIQGVEYGADDYITKPFSASYLKARIISLLKQRSLLRMYYTGNGQQISPSMPQITHFDEMFINQIVQAVEDNLQNPDFTIEDLAITMSMSRTVFYRKIKSLLGVSPIDFVKSMRVKRSVQLLDSNEYTVSEVAYMSGFSSPQYFNRVFKNVMNCTPTEYKMKH